MKNVEIVTLSAAAFHLRKLGKGTRRGFVQFTDLQELLHANQKLRRH